MPTATTSASERIAANARAIRGRKQIKIDALARRAGFSTRKAHRLLHGEQKWFFEDVEAVAAALEVHWSVLVAASEEPAA